MRAVMNGVRAALALGLIAAAHTTACAQGPGSMLQSDILGGEGQFLRGRGIYELYSAWAARASSSGAVASTSSIPPGGGRSTPRRR